jgi:hypothetical protein
LLLFESRKNWKFVTMKDNSTVEIEEIQDNVRYIQGILLLSGCKEMDKI